MMLFDGIYLITKENKVKKKKSKCPFDSQLHLYLKNEIKASQPIYVNL